MGQLERKLDQDLIAKMAAGWKPQDRIEPMRKVSPPRAADSYRAARRNRILREEKTTWRGGVARAVGYWPKQSKKYPYASKRQNSRHATA